MRLFMEHLNQLFVEAGTLMFAGMVFVFIFLGLMIVFINVVLKRLAIKFPDAVVQTRSTRSNQKTKQNVDGVSPKVVAAITSAVSQYRKQHNQPLSNHKTK
ncbi:MAG: oxaloacetate decarboxylase gamma subunit [Colwellia sp.]|jgi:oxaloacetate decarboxylase gamma subunit